LKQILLIFYFEFLRIFLLILTNYIFFNDKESILKALNEKVHVFQHISDEFKENKEFIFQMERFFTTDSSYEDITSELSAVESENIKGVVISVWDNTLGLNY
jgi:hypothetical protein